MSLAVQHSLWEGVYSNFVEAGGDLDAFESDHWIEKQKIKILNKHADLENASLAVSKDYPLPLVASMLLGQQNEISVLDFGGGMGTQYLEILAQVPHSREKMKYCIVDGEATIKNIPPQLQKYEHLKFFSSLEDIREKVDIVHIGSTLQYIEDWKSLLRSLVQNFQPQYFVFSDLLAGDIPTFVSHQNFYDKSIPVWMINIEEFIDYMCELNFYGTYKSFFQANIQGNSVLPNFLLPQNYRISMSLNLIFQKSKQCET